MRLVVVGLALAMFAAGAAAEPLPVQLHDGATWTMTLAHARQTERGGKTEAVSLTTVSRLSWKPRGEGAGLLTITPVSATGNPPEAAKAAQWFDIPVVLEVDETLTPQRVVNMDELRKSFHAMIAAMPSGSAKDGAQTFLEGLTDASVTALATQDVAQLAQVQGSDLEVGKEAAYDQELPNPLGGSPIRSHGAFILVSLDREAGRAVIDWRQSYDPESAGQSVLALVERMVSNVAPDKAAEVRAQLSTMTLERNDSCRYEIDTQSGLVAHADCTATVAAGVRDQVARRADHRVYSLTPPRIP